MLFAVLVAVAVVVAKAPQYELCSTRPNDTCNTVFIRLTGLCAY